MGDYMAMAGPAPVLPGKGVGLTNGKFPTGFRGFIKGLPIEALGWIINELPPAPRLARSGSAPITPMPWPIRLDFELINLGPEIEGMVGVFIISLPGPPMEPGPTGRNPPPPKGTIDCCE